MELRGVRRTDLHVVEGDPTGTPVACGAGPRGRGTRRRARRPSALRHVADLESCILGAAPGDTIEIAADAIPAQSIEVVPGKSFTLRPASGFAPVFADFSSIFAAGGDEDVTVVIEGLTIEHGFIRLVQGGSGTFDVTIRNDTILQSSNFNDAISVGGSLAEPPSGPTLFRIEDNEIAIAIDPTDAVSAISVGDFQGDGNVGTVQRNVIHQVGGGQAGAIEILNINVTLEVDVIANRVSGTNFNSGVDIVQALGGGVVARVINNALSGQVDTAGPPGAISLSVIAGDADFTVVNNTVAYNERGILVGGRADLGATISGVIANNIVAFNDAGLSIEQPFAAIVPNEFNLVFGNGLDFFTPGANTLAVDPLFVSMDDLSLQADSPARNAGSNARVPPDVTVDLAGRARIIDTIVDLGAYEVPEPSGAAGAVAAGLALAALRRRRDELGDRAR